ncbi:MAG: GNAT superfamily N-acetyltransferase [Limisphaerales bacterium]|jgi:GNAT superfamily N-acetyltransferase
MARVIVDTWFVAHKGHVSDEAFQQRRDGWGYAESEKGWRRTIREADGGSAQILVATDEDQVIAVAASEITATNCAEVGSLYVDVSYQRSGIGHRLVKAAIDHYRNLGISTLHIAVLAANGPARRFYESLGGRNWGTRDDPDGLEIVYALDLTIVE